MFELIEAFDPEARRVLFGTVADVFQSGRRDIEPEDILASVLRAPSLSAVTKNSRFNFSGLLARLSAPSPGNGASERLQRVLDHSAEHTTREDAFAGVGLKKGGGFLTLPLSPRGKETFTHLSAAFAGAAAESVTPKQVLITMLRSDQQLTAVCAEFGLHVEVL